MVNRQQQVKINDKLSNVIDVTSGVSQGGRLSPLLFLLFVNDLVTIFQNVKCLLFTDDLGPFTATRIVLMARVWHRQSGADELKQCKSKN